jgi:FtsH-binding integral membrane protein
VDTAAAQATRVPQDTDDTRRQHFARLVKHPLTLSLGSTAAIAAFVFATMFVNPAVGAAAAVGVILLTLLIVFLIASGRATEDFFRAYADGRALREKKGPSPRRHAAAPQG